MVAFYTENLSFLLLMGCNDCKLGCDMMELEGVENKWKERKIK